MASPRRRVHVRCEHCGRPGAATWARFCRGCVGLGHAGCLHTRLELVNDQKERIAC